MSKSFPPGIVSLSSPISVFRLSRAKQGKHGLPKLKAKAALKGLAESYARLLNSIAWWGAL